MNRFTVEEMNDALTETEYAELAVYTADEV